MEAIMASALGTKLYRTALGTTLAVAAAATFAQSPEQRPGAPDTILLAQASSTPAARTAATPAADEYPPLQAGVRKAAAEGPEALRRYVHRTRMIYAWYYPDFVQ
jgi:hypothetical protein